MKALRRSHLVIALAAGLVLLAVVPRFINLGVKPVMHDESLFAYYSYLAMVALETPPPAAVEGQPAPPKPPIYMHMPILHGPTLTLVSAWLFHWFGDSIAVVRAWIAAMSLLGIAAAWALWPRRTRWLLLPLLLTSPILLFYSRFYRNDALFCVILTIGTLGMARGMTRRPNAILWSILGPAMFFTLLALMESALFVYAAGAFFGVICLIFRLLRWLFPRTVRRWRAVFRAPRPIQARDVPKNPKKKGTPPPAIAPAPLARGHVWQSGRINAYLGWTIGVLAGLIVIAVVYGIASGQAAPLVLADDASAAKRIGMSVLKDFGWLNLKASWDYWEGQHVEHRIAGAFHYHLPILLTYELPIFLMVYVGIAWDAALGRRRLPLHVVVLAAWALFWLLWRALLPAGATEPPAGLIGKALVFLHLEPSASSLIVGLLIVPMLVWTCLALVERRVLGAWMAFWAACSLFQYSAAGEKVPWLAIHIALPYYLAAGWIWGPLLARRTKPVRVVFIALAIVGALIGLRNDLRFLGEDQANPRERLVYNHTTSELDRIIKRNLALWELDTAAKSPKERRILLIDDPVYGGPTWPGFWYFRRNTYIYTAAAEPQLNKEWDLVIGATGPLQPALTTQPPGRWKSTATSLRDHWLAPWPQEQRWRDRMGATMTSREPLAPLVRDTLRDLWRYYWLREPWTPPGNFPIIVLEPIHR